MRTFVIKKYFFSIVLLFILSACGIGKKEVAPNESAVLSGPPLAIPPDFDMQEPSNNNLDAPQPGDIVIQEDNENFANIPTLEDNENFANIPTLEEEAPYPIQDSQETINTFDSNNMQDFETFNPNKVQTFIPQQTENNKAKLSRQPRRASVPSDVYDLDMTRLNNTNRQKRTTKDYFGSENIGLNKFEEQNNKNLSKEEESLLEEIIIEDFEAIGDLD